jgi:hypothetical protein
MLATHRLGGEPSQIEGARWQPGARRRWNFQAPGTKTEAEAETKAKAEAEARVQATTE